MATRTRTLTAAEAINDLHRRLSQRDPSGTLRAGEAREMLLQLAAVEWRLTNLEKHLEAKDAEPAAGLPRGR